MRRGNWAQTAIVERPNQAANRPHTVGALEEPKTRTLNMKIFPCIATPVRCLSEGWLGTWWNASEMSMPKSLAHLPGAPLGPLTRQRIAVVKSHGLGRMILSAWSMVSLTPDSRRSQTSLYYHDPSGFCLETRPSLLSFTSPAIRAWVAALRFGNPSAHPALIISVRSFMTMSGASSADL